MAEPAAAEIPTPAGTPVGESAEESGVVETRVSGPSPQQSSSPPRQSDDPIMSTAENSSVGDAVSETAGTPDPDPLARAAACAFQPRRPDLPFYNVPIVGLFDEQAAYAGWRSSASGSCCGVLRLGESCLVRGPGKLNIWQLI